MLNINIITIFGTKHNVGSAKLIKYHNHIKLVLNIDSGFYLWFHLEQINKYYV